MRIRSIAASAVLIVTCLITITAASGEAAEAVLEDMLPAVGDIAGWTPDGDAFSYLPDNLWEYINGSAENYLMYDFRKVVARHYMDGDEREIKVEIYEHGSPLMAFGIYSQFRSQEADYYDIGNEAFGDAYTLHFWKGRYYVKVYAYDEGEGMGAAMREFAALVEKRIVDGGQAPPEIALFPEKGLVDKSITYMTEGVLGSSKLPPAFVADYKCEDGSGKVYLFSLEDAAAAGRLFDSYTAGVGAEVTKTGEGKGSFRKGVGEAPYRGRIVMVQHGRRAAVLTGFGDGEGAADRLADLAVARMMEAGEK